VGGVDAPFQTLFKDLSVQEQDGVEGLVLSGGGDLLIHGQVGQEGLDFRNAHILGMSLAVIEVDIPIQTKGSGHTSAIGLPIACCSI
jgi:hypothetical protein